MAESQGLYGELAADFDHTFHDNRGGAEIEYVTGEQVTSRLNTVLGFQNWSFRVVQHDLNVEADEMWVLGELTVDVGDKTIRRQQFGSQKIKRSRTSGVPLDIGFDFKGAATDCLKKCASLIGVGLYLYEKDEQPAKPTPITAHQPAPTTGSQPMPQTMALSTGGFQCEECGADLKETRFKDGTSWAPAQLAGFAKRKHGKTLCMDHYRAANEARKAALG